MAETPSILNQVNNKVVALPYTLGHTHLELTKRPTLANLANDPSQQNGLYAYLANLGDKSDGRPWLTVSTRKRRYSDGFSVRSTIDGASTEQSRPPNRRRRRSTGDLNEYRPMTSSIRQCSESPSHDASTRTPSDAGQQQPLPSPSLDASTPPCEMSDSYSAQLLELTTASSQGEESTEDLRPVVDIVQLQDTDEQKSLDSPRSSTDPDSLLLDSWSLSEPASSTLASPLLSFGEAVDLLELPTTPSPSSTLASEPAEDDIGYFLANGVSDPDEIVSAPDVHFTENCFEHYLLQHQQQTYQHCTSHCYPFDGTAPFVNELDLLSLNPLAMFEEHSDVDGSEEKETDAPFLASQYYCW